MCPLLEFEADRRAFLITINSFGTELTKDTREKLYPSCGKLYPQGLKMLSNCDDFEQVRQVADSYANYRDIPNIFMNLQPLIFLGCNCKIMLML